MKNFLIIALTLITVAAKSQTYYIVTAQKSGNWTDANKWNYSTRNDGKNITSIIIPKNVRITLDADQDIRSIGDVELEISGELEVRSDNSLRMTANSVINIKAGGQIDLHANARNNNNNKIEQIIIGNVVKFDGNKEVTINGPATASKTTGASPSGFSMNAMLPVNFVSFTANKSESGIALTWTTTDEVNNNRFEIQRSTDGINFSTVAIVLPDSEVSSTHLYKYNDKYTAKGVVYYRIRQVDHDGKDKFSAVKVLGVTGNDNETKIYVASSKKVVVELKDAEGKVTVRLVSLNGSVITQKTAGAADQKISIDAFSAAAGAYVVHVSDVNGMQISKKVIL